ncbi:MAG: sigma-70 family RNA polymerase sigma factor [Prevotella sp.]|nr:sigma-70 family RNA polymerase sigma factor [Prevotella sp.]
MIDFSQLYNKHIDQLFAFGSRFTSNREMLKDCIQDVFVKLYTRRESLGPIDNVDNYLFISLRNRIHDEFRKNGKMTGDEINDTNMQAVAENEEYYHERMERQQELTDNMEKYFEKLSPRQRQIINLYYIEQKKYEDICRIMGINYQSVRNLMHRSISRLREYAGEMTQVV